MAKPDADKWPMLKEAWDAYGHSIPWDRLFDMKSDRGCYAVLAWKTAAGEVEYADMARAGAGYPWEMQNDGGEAITLKQWNAAKIVPECDWMDIAGL